MLNNLRGRIVELFGGPPWHPWPIDGLMGIIWSLFESSKEHENNWIISSHQRSIFYGSIFLPPTWYVPTITAPLKMVWMIFFWTVVHLGPIGSSPSVLLLHFVFWPGKLWYIIWNMKQQNHRIWWSWLVPFVSGGWYDDNLPRENGHLDFTHHMMDDRSLGRSEGSTPGFL